MAHRVLIRTPMRTVLVGCSTVAIAMAIGASRADAAPAGSAKPAQVTGEVLDREGSAVAGVTIIARGVTLGIDSFQTTTDATGHFRLDGLPSGSYWFIALDAGRTGTSPALPVSSGHLDVVLRLDDEPIRA